MEADYNKKFEDETSKTKSELVEKVDAYLNYVVQEWMKENELAIERGLKGEIAEDFITGLKTLFEEHYIDVPEDKYDILESQATKIEELETKLNETIGKLTEKNKVENNLVKEQVIAKVSQDLAETQTEKFASLVEDVEFTDAETYEDKLNTLKENYFPKSVPQGLTEEEGQEDAKEIDVSGAMAAYMSAIKRQAPYANVQDAQPFNNVKK
jgi:membrane-associated HD superfamily phosphohydrolase